jgi:nitrogen fixation NifU-like protein
MTPDRDEYARQEAELDELYREVILDHYRNPRHRGTLDSPTVSREGYNPLCGDQVTVSLLVDGGVIRDIAYSGQGCSISQSSASMMAEAVAGKSEEEADALFRDFTEMMQGNEEEAPESLGDLEALMGVRKFPVRVKCATLAWHTLEEALESLRQGGP